MKSTNMYRVISYSSIIILKQEENLELLPFNQSKPHPFLLVLPYFFNRTVVVVCFCKDVNAYQA